MKTLKTHEPPKALVKVAVGWGRTSTEMMEQNLAGRDWTWDAQGMHTRV